MSQNSISKIFKKLARKYGVKILVEPEYGYAAQITTQGNKKIYTRGTAFPLNDLGASAIARDKSHTSYFLKKNGFPVPRGRAFYSDGWAKQIGSEETTQRALKFAEKIAWPVIVKPNDASGGELVFLCYKPQEFLRAAQIITSKHDIFIVQEYVAGSDYRLLVLDGELVAAYQRLPLQIIGDGRRTVKKLFQAKKVKIESSGDVLLLRIQMTLKQKKMRMQSVPAKGRTVALLPSANLSNGGSVIDVTEKVDESWRKIARQIARDMNLRFCGIDVIAEKTIVEKQSGYVVLEVNAAPGINRFAASGKRQKKRVMRIYEKLFRKIVE